MLSGVFPAALTILKEYERVKGTDVAALWVVPAFTISAAIIVMLDLLHKLETETCDHDRRALVLEAVSGLERDQNNFMATRGVKLLQTLLRREHELRVAQRQAAQTTQPLPIDIVPGEGGSLYEPYPVEQTVENMEAWYADSMAYFSNPGQSVTMFNDFGFGFSHGHKVSDSNSCGAWPWCTPSHR